ncbi:MAG TPA: hypothetical protein VKE22_07350 [Haliangiales bacterium]|nr:hypothetical protein [Haliangiales bacterium]
MRYAFTAPPTWARAAFPPPQIGVYLRAPVAPGPESASILLFDSVLPAETLAEHLDAFVVQSTEGLKVKAQKPVAVKSAAFPGLMVQLTTQVTGAGGKSREEARLYVLLDAGRVRLPLAFVGGAKALAAHQKTFEAVLQSVAPLDNSTLYGAWAE